MFPTARRTRTALVALLTIICLLTAGFAPVAWAAQGAQPSSAMGRLEVTLTRDGVNVTADYMVMAASDSAPMPVMLALTESGAMAADLPRGVYTVIAIPANAMSNPMAMAGQMPTMFDVSIAAGRTVQKVVDVAAAGDDEFDDWDVEWEEDWDGDDESDEFDDFDDAGGFGQPVDVESVPTADELVALAQAYYDAYWPRLDTQERLAVEAMLRPLTGGQLPTGGGGAGPTPTPSRAAVSEVTTAAVAIAAPGASRAMPVVLAAWAVMVMPDLPLALNNFGAVLRLLGELSDSIAPLVAARDLEPQSPMVLTNLAYSALELGDDDQAELLFKAAVEVDDGFGPALSGLGSIYMERGDLEGALEMMLKGAQLGFCGAVKDAASSTMSSVYSDPKSIPPLPPLVPLQPVTAGSNAGAQTSFTVPRMADWTSIETVSFFMTDEGFPQLEAMIRRELESATAGNQRAVEAVKQAMARQAGAGNEQRRISYESQTFHLNLIYNHFKAILDRATERALEIGAYERGWQEHQIIVDRFMQRVQVATTEAELKAAQAAFCSEVMELSRREFAKNKTAWAQFYDEAATAVEDYWGFAQSVIDTIYDPAVHDYEETGRRMRALGMVAQIASTGAQLALLPVVHQDCGWCGGTGITPSDPGPVKMPPSPNKCPWKDGKKFALSLGPVEYKVDCSTVETGFAFIAAGSLKWDFKQKRVTSVFVGVGGQMGAGPLKVGSKMGTQITFDADGSVSDFTTDWSSSMGVGPFSAEVGIDAGAVVAGPGMQVQLAR